MLSKELHLDEELFVSLLHIETGTLTFTRQEIEDLFKRYAKEIRRLALLIDSERFGKEQQ